MSYLEMALRIGRKLDALNADHSTETRPAPASAHAPVARTEESKGRELAACGSPDCAGCYDVGDGRKIHPPKIGGDFRQWVERWKPKGDCAMKTLK
jgi:hypothetical protein